MTCNNQNGVAWTKLLEAPAPHAVFLMVFHFVGVQNGDHLPHRTRRMGWPALFFHVFSPPYGVQNGGHLPHILIFSRFWWVPHGFWVQPGEDTNEEQQQVAKKGHPQTSSHKRDNNQMAISENLVFHRRRATFSTHCLFFSGFKIFQDGVFQCLFHWYGDFSKEFS